MFVLIFRSFKELTVEPIIIKPGPGIHQILNIGGKVSVWIHSLVLIQIVAARD